MQDELSEFEKEFADDLVEEKHQAELKANDEASQEQTRLDKEEAHKRELARTARLENQRKARQDALKPSPDIDEIYRQAAVKVQFMKSRYKKLFEPDDPEYGIYTRAKRLLSRTEYALRQRVSAEKGSVMARASMDAVQAEEFDREWEKHTKNALYTLYGVNSLYSDFLDGMVQ